MKRINNFGTLKFLLAGTVGLLAVTTQATDLKILDIGGAPSITYNTHMWTGVTSSSTGSPEYLHWNATLPGGTAASGSDVIGLLENSGSLSDLLIVSWTKTTSGDDFDIKFYSGGGFPVGISPNITFTETGKEQRLDHIIAGGPPPLCATIYATSAPDGGMTLMLLGLSLCGIEAVRRKLAAA